MSLSAKIFIGLGLGIVVGVFFGEEVAGLQVIGDVFIQLLQMTILPFVVLSLVTGVGRLTYAEALSLARKAGVVLLLLWTIAVAMVAAIPLAFPDWESASFFSPALAEEPARVDFLHLYIPSNPFYSLSNTIVPAIVLFSIVSGAALIGIENKQRLMEPLVVLLDAMVRVTGFVVQLAPLGVFAITASAAGTIDLEQLGRLVVYLSAFIASSLVLTLWVLPALVANLTPLSYRDVVLPVRSALITAFATGNHMIILPILTERGRDLLWQAELGSKETDSAVEVIVPTSFTFPTAGMLLSLSFVPFAAWFVGADLSVGQYPAFLALGLFSYFGGSIVALPFLLDLLRIPADMFQLFVTVDVFTGRFGALLASMHMWVLALLGSCAMAGRLKVRWAKLGTYVAISAVLALVTLGGTRLFFTYAVDPKYTKYRQFVDMELLNEPAKVRMVESPPRPQRLSNPSNGRLQEIWHRGVLRVGYMTDSLPFAFRNAAEHVVGFDIEMAHQLAKALNVSLDLVKMERSEDQADALNAGICDIVMSGFAMNPDLTARLSYSRPYLDTTVGFVVADYRREEFSTWDRVRKLTGLKIALPTRSRYYHSVLETMLPHAKIVEIASPREFFRATKGEFDALVAIAEAGSAWTLVYPAYTVAVPLPNPVRIPLAYPMPQGNSAFADYVNTWIELKKRDGTIQKLFNHWILGRGAEKHEPRWSVIHNVLHWTD
jgi:proton glutamate symport protein